MNRKISFVRFNRENKIVSRYTPFEVTGLDGFGEERNIDYVQTAQRKFVTQITPAMQDRKLSIWFDSEGDNAYMQSRAFMAWELEGVVEFLHGEQRISIAIEYNDGQQTNYVFGLLSIVPLSERQSGRFLVRAVTFLATSPWRTLIELTSRFEQPIFGKSYPLTYPYTYGSMRITNNIIKNDFYLSIPLQVLCYGFMTNPIIQLLDKNYNIYSQIRMDNLTIKEGEYLLLDGDSKEILLWNGTEFIDVFSHRNPAYDSYFQAMPGTSQININLKSGENGYLVVHRWQDTTV